MSAAKKSTSKANAKAAHLVQDRFDKGGSFDA
jgi:hypothetical protein